MQAYLIANKINNKALTENMASKIGINKVIKIYFFKKIVRQNINLLNSTILFKFSLVERK